jgi:hypothetical protein
MMHILETCNDITQYFAIKEYGFDAMELNSTRVTHRRSQWPRGLRHELSSLALTLGSWVRIPQDMDVYVSSVCVVLCVGSGLATG